MGIKIPRGTITIKKEITLRFNIPTEVKFKDGKTFLMTFSDCPKLRPFDWGEFRWTAIEPDVQADETDTEDEIMNPDNFSPLSIIKFDEKHWVFFDYINMGGHSAVLEPIVRKKLVPKEESETEPDKKETPPTEPF